jgi:hypothetical protein
MKGRILGFLTVSLLGAATTASAIPLRLDATSVDASGFSSFFVIFEDTGDGLLQVEEATLFSGSIDPSDGSLYDLLVGVPDIADISTLSGFCPLSDRWCFVSPQIGLLVAISTDSFTYAITPAPVVEPGTLALCGLGLLGLGLTRRRAST